jgi:hypothetical protein
MKEYQLSEPLTKGFFEYLKHFGRVESVPGLGDGYYNFEKTNWFSIKGFVGDDTVEVRFKREVMDTTSDFLRILFTAYREDGTADIAGLKKRTGTRRAD